MPGVTARARARKRRTDAIVAGIVRELVEARDGFCRYAWDVPPSDRSRCAGQSEWAHWDGWKRFKTRGQDPTARHLTTGSLMLCTFHHRLYDAHRLTITALSTGGCDGALGWEEPR